MISNHSLTGHCHDHRGLQGRKKSGFKRLTKGKAREREKEGEFSLLDQLRNSVSQAASLTVLVYLPPEGNSPQILNKYQEYLPRLWEQENEFKHQESIILCCHVTKILWGSNATFGRNETVTLDFWNSSWIPEIGISIPFPRTGPVCCLWTETVKKGSVCWVWMETVIHRLVMEDDQQGKQAERGPPISQHAGVYTGRLL